MSFDAAVSIELVLDVAARQHGVVLRSQLRECGLDDRRILRLVRDGWIKRIRIGAYVVGGARSPWQEAVAVGLLAGDGAVLSHATAAAIHRFPLLVAGEIPEVTVPPHRHPRLPGARVHRSRHLDPRDIQPRGSLSVTTPTRTLVDLAGRLEASLLARVIDEGSIRRLWTIDQLVGVANRVGGRGWPGNAELRRLLDIRAWEPRGDTVLEQRVIRALAPFSPFETQYQLVLDDLVVLLDVAWPLSRVGVESDGRWERTRSRTKFDQDRRKGNLLAAAGWAIVHVTSTMTNQEIVDAVARLFPPSQRGSMGHPRLA